MARKLQPGTSPGGSGEAGPAAVLPYIYFMLSLYVCKQKNLGPPPRGTPLPPAGRRKPSRTLGGMGAAAPCPPAADSTGVMGVFRPIDQETPASPPATKGITARGHRSLVRGHRP
ncbi:MAG: hypothetical protein AMXMBFR83_13960 [Phycisphaerae bacterium]